MAAPRILILNDHPDVGNALSELPDALRQSAPELELDVVRQVTDALRKLTGDPYDALVCVADTEDELSVLVRIREKDPDVPVVLVTDPAEPRLKRLGTKLGATEVAERTNDPHGLVEVVRRATAVGRLAKNPHNGTEQGHGEVREPAKEARRLSKAATDANRGYSYARLVPLLVEDVPEQAYNLIQAFAKAGMPFPLPIMKTAKEAVAYLAGTEPYADRLRHPWPTLVLLDLDLGAEPAFRLLSWIRKESLRRHLPVVILTSTKNLDERRKAYELGVNSFLVKPADFEGLVELVRSIGVYWTSFNLGLDV